METAVTKNVAINADRLYKSLEQLGAIGAYLDESSGLTGVRRLTLSDEDRAGRELVVSWLKEAGLSVSIDQIGNIYGMRAGSASGLAPLMIGSHTDSVPTGGRFDGALGVLGGIEIVRTLNDKGITTRRPIVVADFTNEEGCRFCIDMLGSSVATGRVSLEEGYGLTDAEGKIVRDELERIGFLGTEPVGQWQPHAYLECHVEQGPTLLTEGFDVGVVTGVQAISWQGITIEGKAAHAGATPTAYRCDAGLVAALLNVRAREMAESGTYAELRAAMGVINPEPGAVNVIPGRVEATIDLRDPDDEAMTRAEHDLRAYADALAKEHKVTVEWKRLAKTDYVPFDSTVQDSIERTANTLGLSNRRLIAGAGHDAQEWARVCKAAMVFAPGEYDGISHNPREYSTSKQCADAVNVLLRSAIELANEP